MMNPSVTTSTGSYYHDMNESATKCYSRFANPGSVEQTTWSTLDGCRVEANDVIDALHNVANDARSSSMVVAEKFADEQCYSTTPPRPPRSHLGLLQWSFRGGTRGNAVPIVKIPLERMGTALDTRSLRRLEFRAFGAQFWRSHCC